MFLTRKAQMMAPEQTLAGRTERTFALPERHRVLDAPLVTDLEDGVLPEGHEVALFGLGCFWGAEKKFWSMPGVYSTAVGYAAGHTMGASIASSAGAAGGIRAASAARSSSSPWG